MKKKLIRLLGLGCLFFLFSCAHLSEHYLPDNTNPVYAPKRIDLFLIQPVSFPVKKALYSGRYQTLYVLDDINNEVYIYKNNKLINRIGSNSSGSYQLMKISDICLAQDGYFWALDHFEKALLKFDSNGMLITRYVLSETVNPTLFVFSENSSIMVWDKAKNEILVYESIGLKYIYSFAKFMLSQPLNISAEKSRILIYDHDQKKTFVLLSTGKLILEQNGQAFYDKNLNYYTLENETLVNRDNHFSQVFINTATDKIDLNEQYITQIGEKQINVYEIFF